MMAETRTTITPNGNTTPTATTTPNGKREDVPSKPRIVVLGGGVAGLTAAYELRRRLGDRAEITLISDSERFVLGLALLWVPFGRRPGSISFPLAPALARKGIRFVSAYVERIDPEHRVVLAHGEEIPYDYVLIATGPRADREAIPGVSGQFNATETIWSERSAVAAGRALKQFLDQPGPVVIGAAPGAAYLSAAYEFALLLDYTLRRRHRRHRATITFVTPEPYLGHLDIGSLAASRALAQLFARRRINVLTDVTIERVDADGVHLAGGTTLAAAYTMVVPPFSGVAGVAYSPLLADEHGFVHVDGQYRHVLYPEIYAAGVAAHVAATSPVAIGLPRTGYLAQAMAKAAAHNMAAAITGSAPAPRTLPRLLDLRLIDGGDAGVLLVSADLRRPLRLALPLPGHVTHWTKKLLARYLLWKLRTGRADLP